MREGREGLTAAVKQRSMEQKFSKKKKSIAGTLRSTRNKSQALFA